MVRKLALLGTLILAAACGGVDEPKAPGPVCDVGGMTYACDGGVIIIRDAGAGTTVSDMCSATGCYPGERCVVVTDRGVEEGTCR